MDINHVIKQVLDSHRKHGLEGARTTYDYYVGKIMTEANYALQEGRHSDAENLLKIYQNNSESFENFLARLTKMEKEQQTQAEEQLALSRIQQEQEEKQRAEEQRRQLEEWQKVEHQKAEIKRQSEEKERLRIEAEEAAAAARMQAQQEERLRLKKEATRLEQIEQNEKNLLKEKLNNLDGRLKLEELLQSETKSILTSTKRALSEEREQHQRTVAALNEAKHKIFELEKNLAQAEKHINKTDVKDSVTIVSEIPGELILKQVFNFVNLQRISMVCPRNDNNPTAVTIDHFYDIQKAPELREAFNKHVAKGGKTAEETVFPPEALQPLSHVKKRIDGSRLVLKVDALDKPKA